MLDNLINNYYFSNFIYSLVFISLAISINEFMYKRKIYIKEKMKLKEINIKFLIRMLCLSIFIKIGMEQLQLYFNIEMTNDTFDITVLSLIIYFIVRCIVAPITEEIIFRFGIFEFLNIKLNYSVAILITSFIFSFGHGYLLFDSLTLLIISIVWNYSYYKTDNLLYPIFLHFIFNLLSFISFICLNNLYYIYLGIVCFVIWIILYMKKSS